MDNPTLMDNPAIWGFAGAVTTAVIGLIAALVKYRSEQRKVDAEVQKVKVDTESIAVAAAEKALATVTTALDREIAANADRDAKIAAQDQALVDAGKRLTSSEERMTEMGKAVGEVRRLHREAIIHIADRERWTAQQWPGARPETLAEIPAALRADVIEVAPDLATVVVITPREHTDDEETEDEEPQPRARLPPNE